MTPDHPPLRRALLAEFLGTAGLLMVLVGSGIMGERLSQGNPAIALLANAFATGCGLYVLIVAFAPVSGAHFNPLVSVLAWFDGALESKKLLAYLGTQVAAAVTGTLLAHAMFGLDLLQTGVQRRTGAGQFLSEVIATAGLILMIRSLARRDSALVAATVGTYIAAAYWFTASTSFANPAVTLARSLTTSFSGIAPVDVPLFLLAQSLGAVLGLLLSRALWTDFRRA